ncbi:hypothetical protein K1719_034354 [Acacia pycnantha]|nr:hypothetical protein K1719_034354 [Acacia pycnantha]
MYAPQDILVKAWIIYRESIRGRDNDDVQSDRELSPEPQQQGLFDDLEEDIDDWRGRERSQTPVYDNDSSMSKAKPRKRIIKKGDTESQSMAPELADEDEEANGNIPASFVRDGLEEGEGRKRKGKDGGSGKDKRPWKPPLCSWTLSHLRKYLLFRLDEIRLPSRFRRWNLRRRRSLESPEVTPGPLEFIDIREEYVKDEQKNLKRELLRAREEHHQPRALEALGTAALHRHSNALVDVLPPEADSRSRSRVGPRSLDVTYNDIGGCDIQKQEIREAVELPLTHHELYKQIGIDPPRGVLLYSPHGTGKTMLAKAIANHTTAAFIRVVGSEFVQKYLGEGPRMVRDVFRLAKENAPAIIFIDEVDAIATARFDAQTGADREVQRILMELLNQMDGFDQTVNGMHAVRKNRYVILPKDFEKGYGQTLKNQTPGT